MRDSPRDAGRPASGIATAVALAVLPLCSVAPLLAWVFRLGTFRTWALATTVPALAVTTVLGARECGRWRAGRSGVAVTVGVLGGLVGTIGYDLFRVPFLALGLRLLAPIDSYGVLLLGADASNQLTATVGWAFHFANGICFGIAFAVVALGRAWRWGLLWAMVLETATVVTPFADTYGLRGRPDLIAIAYLAHVPYGLFLGLAVQHGTAVYRRVHEVARRPVTVALGGLAAVLLVWLRPLPPYGTEPATEIAAARFSPAWVRVRPGGCAQVHNTDQQAYRLRGADGGAVVPAGGTRRVCFSDEGVLRVRTSDRPFSGGFVIVDPEAR